MLLTAGVCDSVESLSVSILPSLPAGAAGILPMCPRSVQVGPQTCRAVVTRSLLNPLDSGCSSRKHIVGRLRGLRELSDMQTHTRWINGCWKSLLTIIPRVLLAVLKCYRSNCQRLRSGLQGRTRPQEYSGSSLFFRHSFAVIIHFTGYFLKQEFQKVKQEFGASIKHWRSKQPHSRTLEVDAGRLFEPGF